MHILLFWTNSSLFIDHDFYFLIFSCLPINMHLYSDFNIYKSEIFGFLLSFLIVFCLSFGPCFLVVICLN